MHGMAEGWISVNKFWMDLAHPTHWEVGGLARLNMSSSYLIVSNHQSWVDILILQYQLNRRIPLLKLFLKRSLIWVPVIGLCWWALEFPFMRRYSKEYLARHPEKRGHDLATTRKACERYKGNPVSIFNFLEGTRMTPKKRQTQRSPFQHLLKPKAGGIAFVLDAMGEHLDAIGNVTIHYPGQTPSFWDLLCGRLEKVVLRLDVLSIPAEFLGRNYEVDEGYRSSFQQWINQLWRAKDQELATLHRSFPD